mgnify:FL=1
MLSCPNTFLPPQVRELVDQTTWEEHCTGHAADAELDVPEIKAKQLCLVAFLPHILDSGAAGREGYLQVGVRASLRVHVGGVEGAGCGAARAAHARLFAC